MRAVFAKIRVQNVVEFSVTPRGFESHDIWTRILAKTLRIFADFFCWFVIAVPA
jgi:hypothetical protein